MDKIEKIAVESKKLKDTMVEETRKNSKKAFSFAKKLRFINEDEITSGTEINMILRAISFVLAVTFVIVSSILFVKFDEIGDLLRSLIMVVLFISPLLRINGDED